MSRACQWDRFLIDGPSARDQNSEVLRERKALARDGVVVVVVSVDGLTRLPTSHRRRYWPADSWRAEETDDLFPRLAETVDDLLQEKRDLMGEPDRIKNLIREAAGRFIRTEARRRPTIVACTAGNLATELFPP